MNYKKLVSIVSLVILSLATVLFPVLAATEQSVTATITVQNISLTVTDGTVTYGTLGTSDAQDTTTAGLDDSQTVTNTGNITEDFNIKGQNSANWTLAASAGSEEYAHEFCITDCDSSPSWTALTTTYGTLNTGIASSNTQLFDLQISTPTSTANFTQQSVDVMVQAVAN